MATVKGPLFSLDAAGSIAKTVVFSKWKGRNYVRRHIIPANPRSGLQVGIRSVFKYITQDWANLSAADIQDWDNAAAADNITGLDAQVRDAITRARRNLGWRENLTDTPLGTIDPPTSPTTTAQPKTLVLDWTRPISNQGDYTAAIYMSTSMGFTADISNLIGVITVTSLTLTVPNLITGTTYYWRVRETDTAGGLGTLSAEDSGVPT